jgi:DoxX-like family
MATTVIATDSRAFDTRVRTKWVGYVLTAACTLQLLMSVGAKLVMPVGVPEHFASLGWQLGDVRQLAFLELALTLCYLVPRTSFWGLILLTGYLGGATAAHVRIGDGVFLYPLLLGAGLWVALLVRAPRLRAVVMGNH